GQMSDLVDREPRRRGGDARKAVALARGGERRVVPLRRLPRGRIPLRRPAPERLPGRFALRRLGRPRGLAGAGAERAFPERRRGRRRRPSARVLLLLRLPRRRYAAADLVPGARPGRVQSQAPARARASRGRAAPAPSLAARRLARRRRPHRAQLLLLLPLAAD